MTANTSRTQLSGSPQSEPVKPTKAEAAIAFLRKPAKPVKAAPAHEEIGVRAYEIWLSTGQQPGRDQEHWFLAEQQLSQS